MNSISAKCGHVKRRLGSGEPLQGDLLAFALDVIGETTDKYTYDIPRKLREGEKLTDYELHLFVDVFLLHERLGAQREAKGPATISRT